jgi:hypothetical protein
LAKIVPARSSVPRLVQIRNHASQRTRHWVIATLGQMSPTSIRLHVNDAELAAQLVPFQLTSEETNWTRSEQITEMLTFVRKQTIPPTA